MTSEPLDPWAATDPDIFAGHPIETERVPDLTATEITPRSWLLDHGPTIRHPLIPRAGRHRAGPLWSIMRKARGRLRRSR